MMDSARDLARDLASVFSENLARIFSEDLARIIWQGHSKSRWGKRQNAECRNAVKYIPYFKHSFLLEF